MKPGTRIKHLKRQSEYVVLGPARVQCDQPIIDMADMIVYQAADGTLWVRPVDEFTPDRFEVL
jgi:hypothetical protein